MRSRRSFLKSLFTTLAILYGTARSSSPRVVAEDQTRGDRSAMARIDVLIERDGTEHALRLRFRDVEGKICNETVRVLSENLVMR